METLEPLDVKSLLPLKRFVSFSVGRRSLVLSALLVYCSALLQLLSVILKTCTITD